MGTSAQTKESCRIKLERHLENEAMEKSSVKGDIPQVAMDLQERVSVYDHETPATCQNGRSRQVTCVYALVRCLSAV